MWRDEAYLLDILIAEKDIPILIRQIEPLVPPDNSPA